MSLFCAIALTAIFLKLKMATAWIVWCWIAFGAKWIIGIIVEIIKRNV